MTKERIDKMKKMILIATKLIDISIISTLKQRYNITYNANDPNIEIIIDYYNIKLKHYPTYIVPYKHFINTSSMINLSFILDSIDDTYDKLNSIQF
jgi:hypothetical protein